MTLLALVAVAVALGLAYTTWNQRRDAQERSAARVAALAAGIDGPLDRFTAETDGAGLKTGGYRPAPTDRRLRLRSTRRRASHPDGRQWT